MITAGQRLRQLAGRDGGAGALLLGIGTGVSAGAALCAYSGLGTATAAQHLLAQRHGTGAAPGGARGGIWRRLRARRKREEELLWMKPI